MNRSTRTALLPLVALIAMFSTGCAGDARKSLPETFPTSVGEWHHGTLDRVEFLQKFALNEYARVIVEPVTTTGVPLPAKDENTYEPVTKALANSTRLLVTGVQSGVKGAIPIENGIAASGKCLILKSKIWTMDPGSQAARYWAGFGAGKAETRITGEIVDSASGKTLLKFEDTKTSSGGVFGGGYDSLLESELTGAGADVGVLLGAFAPPK